MRVDRRCRARGTLRGARRGRPGLHQRHGRLGRAAAVRRREAIGLRTGARVLRDSRVHEHPDGVDGPGQDLTNSTRLAPNPRLMPEGRACLAPNVAYADLAAAAAADFAAFFALAACLRASTE